MTIHRYRRELAQPIAETPVYPYVLRTFRSRVDVPALHALLQEACPARGASPGGCDDWWQLLCTDPEFDARLVFLVETPIGTLAAAGIARRTGSIKALAVAPGYRRQGLGKAVLAQICRTFEQQGAHAVDSDVDAGNEAAIALYETVGMRRVEMASAVAF